MSFVLPDWNLKSFSTEKTPDRVIGSFHEEFEVAVVHGTANSFLDSLIINRSFQSDILLLDIGLPGISGLEAIPLILEKMPELNIVMLTTYEEEDVILKALCSGACSYISKKASLEEIVEALRIVAAGGSYMSPSIAREIVNHLMGGRVSKATILTKIVFTPPKVVKEE